MSGRATLFAIGSVGVAALLWGMVMHAIPRSQDVDIVVGKPVMETQTQDYTVMVPGPDGKWHPETRTRQVQVVRTVTETQTHEVQPSREDNLQFYALVGVAIFTTVYAMIVLAAWARDVLLNKRKTDGRVDTAERLNKLITFTLGILAGFLGGQDPNKSVALEALRERLAAQEMLHRQVIDPYGTYGIPQFPEPADVPESPPLPTPPTPTPMPPPPRPAPSPP